MTKPTPSVAFTGYQKFVIAILAFLQFTIVLDFMILSPLGAILLTELSITTEQFGLVVSAYAFSAGLSGLLAAGFADRFDRKRLLLFFYAGFVLGTLFCGLAPNYHYLLIARIVTGLFGGVIGSISFAIIADLFPMQQRGQVMGFVQTAFAVSQVAGIPLGLYLATHLGWHAPFLLIVAVSILGGIVIWLKLKPVRAHLEIQSKHSPFQHMLRTATKPRYLAGFSATILLATGGFMLMPFGAAFSVHNLGIPLEQLPIVYVLTGISSIIAGPLIGKLSDKKGKITVFTAGSIAAIGLVIWFTHLGISPLWFVVCINMALFAAITARMISATALASAMPSLSDRGAYMAVNSSLQQISGGIAAWVAGLVVHQTASGHLEHYPRLGWIVAVAMLVTLPLMYNIDRMVRESNSPHS